MTRPKSNQHVRIHKYTARPVTYGFTISLEKNTIRHAIAQQTLRSKGIDPTSPTGDYEIFVGNVAEKSLYDDMIAANSKKINKEENRKLEL